MQEIRKLPDAIQAFIEGKQYEENQVGKSDSDVLMFDDMVLKIQKENSETDNEIAILRWLEGKLPAARVLAYEKQEGMAYSLESRVPGKMICDEFYMTHPELLIHIIGDAFRSLWALDISDCPTDVSNLDARLKVARYNVEHDLVDIDGVEEDTFGPNGFENPEALLNWLESNKPDVDPVFTHGDFCLPNLFAEGEQISAFIDLGKSGPADRWQDLAICLRSLEHNFNGYYDGKTYPGYSEEMLLKELGIEFDEERYRYYFLLDELF